MLENYDLLPPDSLSDAINERISNLENAIKAVKLQQKHAPKGALRISNSGNRTQYYFYTDRRNTNGKYLSSSRMPLIKQLAQKAYNAKFIQRGGKQIKLLKQTLKKYAAYSPQKIYENTKSNRRSLINPVTLSDEQYSSLWSSKKYNGKVFQENVPELYTSDGLRVRSKSEILIAEALKANKIPFRYEYPITLKNGRTIYPDFYCLNPKNRKEYIWEHFGLTDDSDYCKKSILKLSAYSESERSVGTNLIISSETQENPLTPREIYNLIKLYLF